MDVSEHERLELPATGSVTPWNPNIVGAVHAIASHGSNVYVGGFITSVGGQPRVHLAALDAVSGAPTSWTPGANYIVRDIDAIGPTLYLGGEFSSVGGFSQHGLASFSDPPASTVRPVISGFPSAGQTLTTSTGSWAGSVPMSFSFQWFRDGAAISGATSSSYVVSPSDPSHFISAQVTARNLGGAASAASDPVSILAAAPPPPPPPPAPAARCRVPRVIGLRLKAARSRIQRGNCRVGRVRHARSRVRRGRVIAQKPGRGKRLARGARSEDQTHAQPRTTLIFSVAPVFKIANTEHHDPSRCRASPRLALHTGS